MNVQRKADVYFSMLNKNVELSGKLFKMLLNYSFYENVQRFYNWMVIKAEVGNLCK